MGIGISPARDIIVEEGGNYTSSSSLTITIVVAVQFRLRRRLQLINAWRDATFCFLSRT